ncbi:MAG: hypothetical protein VYA34_03620 [Myxococcota bacterium]|nr:hypothetical protein [Myxococcota bacterium]
MESFLLVLETLQWQHNESGVRSKGNFVVTMVGSPFGNSIFERYLFVELFVLVCLSVVIGLFSISLLGTLAVFYGLSASFFLP